MSIRRRPEEAILGLLKRIHQAKDLIVESVDQRARKDLLISRLINIDKKLQILKIQLSDVKIWADTVMAKFTQLEHQIFTIFSDAKNKSGQQNNIDTEIEILDRTIELLQKALQPPAPGETKSSQKYDGGDIIEALVAKPKMSEKWLELRVEANILESPALRSLQRSYNNLESLHLKLCFLSFSIFLENAAIKKRPLIYWWISEGFVATEEVGEDNFMKLIKFGLIKPYPNNPDKPITIVNECTVHPWTRYMLIPLAKQAGLFFFFYAKGTPCDVSSRYRRTCLVFGNQNFSEYSSGSEDKLLGLFNVSEKYLDLKPDLLPKSKNVEILQLGGCQPLPKTRNEGAKYHIEVVNEELMKGLGPQKHLKYLSLRGISRISTLPSSISDLFNLEILDLKACHNLETLPFDISKLRKLTHLDLADCPLLERMPKGLDKLTNLQVLKGYMIGDLDKGPSSISHLANMKKLRRLGVYIGAEAAVRKGEFSVLRDLKSLRCLTITWGVKAPDQVDMRDLFLPADLEKLDLRGIPCMELVDLKPSKLSKLKRLYVRGGELSSLSEDCEWAVEILRLKYLKDFKMDEVKLYKNFPHLIYAEVKCDGQVESNENVIYKEDFVLSKRLLEEEKKSKEKGKTTKPDNCKEGHVVLTDQKEKCSDKGKGKSKVEDN